MYSILTNVFFFLMIESHNADACPNMQLVSESVLVFLVLHTAIHANLACLLRSPDLLSKQSVPKYCHNWHERMRQINAIGERFGKKTADAPRDLVEMFTQPPF